MSNQLKVGDRVRVVTPKTILLIGEKGIVEDIHLVLPNYYCVRFSNGTAYWIEEKNIELATGDFFLLKQTLIDLAETSEAAKDILSKEFPDLFPKPVLIKQEIIETVDEDWVAGFAVGKQDCLRVNDSNYTASIINDNGAAYIKFTRK